MKFLDSAGFSDKSPRHYHGDIVRVCFFIAALLMLSGLPFFQDRIPLPVSLSMGAIVMLIFLAGLTNPLLVWLLFTDTVASLFGLVIFEYFAVTNFDLSSVFFYINQTLAILFLIAFYFSTKSLRGFYLRK